MREVRQGVDASAGLPPAASCGGRIHVATWRKEPMSERKLVRLREAAPRALPTRYTPFSIFMVGIATVLAPVSNMSPNPFCRVRHGVNLSSLTASGPSIDVMANQRERSASAQRDPTSDSTLT
jgi:hypothetical protein